MRKQTLVFSDSDGFYKQLTAALKAGDEIEVLTDYERYSELPDKLKSIFKLDRTRSGQWVNSAGFFIPGAVVPGSLSVKALTVLSSTAVGAAIGARVYSAPGAAIGAVIGLAAGCAASILMDRSHEVDIEIDVRGKMKIHLRPAGGR